MQHGRTGISLRKSAYNYRQFINSKMDDNGLFRSSVTGDIGYFKVPFQSVFNQKEGLIPRSLLRNKLFQDMEEEIY